LEVFTTWGIEILSAAFSVYAPKPIVNKIMLPHVLNLGFIQRAVFETHHTVAKNNAFKMDIVSDITLVIF
jgi:hypothetical protein